MATKISRESSRSSASGSAHDLETAAKAALVKRSATSEKTADERLADAKDQIAVNAGKAAGKRD